MKLVVSHRPKDQLGGSGGRPVRRVYRSSASRGVGPSMSDIFQPLPCGGKLNLRDLFRRHFKLDAAGFVDEDAPAAIGDEKRNVLVCLIGRCAAVPVPDFHALAVADKGSEPLAEAVDAIADAEVEPLEQILRVVRPMERIARPFRLAAGQALVVVVEIEAEVAGPLDPDGERARSHPDEVVVDLDGGVEVCISGKSEMRLSIETPREMLVANGNQTLGGSR